MGLNSVMPATREPEWLILRLWRERDHRLLLRAIFIHSAAVALCWQLHIHHTTKHSPTSESPCFNSEHDCGCRARAPAQHRRPRLTTEVLSKLSTYLSHLTYEQRLDIEMFINTSPKLFGDIPSCTTVVEHDSNVGNAMPIMQHTYRVNMTKREMMNMEVDYLLQHRLAIPSYSQWNSTCLVTPKSDGTPFLRSVLTALGLLLIGVNLTFLKVIGKFLWQKKAS